MRIDRSKEWWAARTSIEGDSPIGAGSLNATVPSHRVQAEALLDEWATHEHDPDLLGDPRIEEFLVVVERHLSVAAQVAAEEVFVMLRDHWPQIICNHAQKTDTAQCSCCTYEPPVCQSVGGAVESWIDHLRAIRSK